MDVTLYRRHHIVFSFGSCRSTFTVDGVWTATLVKEDDAWKIASFQSSAGLFDNPLLTMAEGWIVKAAGIAGVAGLVIGALAIALLKRNKS